MVNEAVQLLLAPLHYLNSTASQDSGPDYAGLPLSWLSFSHPFPAAWVGSHWSCGME